MTVARIAAALVCLLVLGAGGCGKKPQVIEKNPYTKEFLLGPEDVLDVAVWRNEDLSRTVVVRPDGMISLPLIGDVRAVGLTANQLAELITKRMTEYKTDARVTVNVKEVNSYYVYLLGEVAKPGKYQLKTYTTVLQAVSMAGGFTPFASKNDMQVVRNMVNGFGSVLEVRIPVHYDDLLKGKGDPGNLILMPGDIIVVP